MNAMRCAECDEGTVRLLAKPGRRASFHFVPNLTVPADLAIPTCDRCGAEWFDADAASAYDAAMATVLEGELRARARRLIDRILQDLTVAEAEWALGVSQGYLSRIRSGKRKPSIEFVHHLAELSAQPRQRLQFLENFWNQGTPG